MKIADPGLTIKKSYDREIEDYNRLFSAKAGLAMSKILFIYLPHTKIYIRGNACDYRTLYRVRISNRNLNQIYNTHCYMFWKTTLLKILQIKVGKKLRRNSFLQS